MSGRVFPVVVLLLVQLGVLLAAWHFGTHAISDDDYARVVIAQKFAAAPSLDPSGTSWLPFPFFVTGSAMTIFGATIEVARVVQWTLALASIGLLYLGALQLGHGRWTAALSAALAASLPSVARLAVATVPEYPTAACMAFAMLSLVRSDTPARIGLPPGAAKLPTSVREAIQGPHAAEWLGALALVAATASRYEAWPVAAAFAGVSLYRAIREGDESGFLRASLALSFPLAWLLHGIVRHDDPLFFLTRVTEYKAALGDVEENPWASYVSYPLAALRHEPGVWILFGVALSTWRPSSTPTLRSLWPLLATFGTLLLVLVLGDVRGGAPTHHPERALLSLWLAMPLVSLRWLTLGAEEKSSARPWVLPAAAILISLLASLWRPETGAFADRADEERVGQLLQKSGAKVLLLTKDYGYLAVQAAAGLPGRFIVLDDHDPRQDRTREAAEERAWKALESRAKWAVLPVGVKVPGYELVQSGQRVALWRASER